jgi:hypothetical protein
MELPREEAWMLGHVARSRAQEQSRARKEALLREVRSLTVTGSAHTVPAWVLSLRSSDRREMGSFVHFFVLKSAKKADGAGENRVFCS